MFRGLLDSRHKISHKTFDLLNAIICAAYTGFMVVLAIYIFLGIGESTAYRQFLLTGFICYCAANMGALSFLLTRCTKNQAALVAGNLVAITIAALLVVLTVHIVTGIEISFVTEMPR